MMNNEKISEMLSDVKSKLKTLKRLAEEKQRAIIELDYDKIESITKQEEIIVDEMTKIEENLKNVVDKHKLEKMGDELKVEAEQVKKINIENRYLIFHSIAFIKKLTEIFQLDVSISHNDISKINKRV